MEDIFKNRDLWLIVLFVGAIQGYFMALILLFNKRLSSIANKFLAGLILCVAIFMTEYLLISSSWNEYFVHFLGITKPFFLLMGPFYFFYTIHLLGISSAYRKWSALLFLPAIAKLIYSLDLYLLSAERKYEIIDFLMTQENLPIRWGTFAIASAPILLMLGYIYFSQLKIKSIEKDFLKNSIKLRLSWLKKFNLAFASFWIIYEISLLIITLNSTYSIKVDYMLALTCGVFIYVLTYLSITQSKYLAASYPEIDKKYEKSSLPDEISKAYLNRILAYFNDSKPFINQEFKLTDLASALNLSPNHVSQVLNKELKKSFHEFVNEYRNQEAIKLMSDPDYDHFSLQGIAEEVGFNSKSSFNRSFKKHTGKTPSEFLKENKVSKA
jgi:AraC-like DNA-binding protein